MLLPPASLGLRQRAPRRALRPAAAAAASDSCALFGADLPARAIDQLIELRRERVHARPRTHRYRQPAAGRLARQYPGAPSSCDRSRQLASPRNKPVRVVSLQDLHHFLRALRVRLLGAPPTAGCTPGYRPIRTNPGEIRRPPTGTPGGRRGSFRGALRERFPSPPWEICEMGGRAVVLGWRPTLPRLPPTRAPQTQRMNSDHLWRPSALSGQVFSPRREARRPGAAEVDYAARPRARLPPARHDLVPAQHLGGRPISGARPSGSPSRSSTARAATPEAATLWKRQSSGSGAGGAVRFSPAGARAARGTAWSRGPCVGRSPRRSRLRAPPSPCVAEGESRRRDERGVEQVLGITGGGQQVARVREAGATAMACLRRRGG
jgi:hypothetical protein